MTLFFWIYLIALLVPATFLSIALGKGSGILGYISGMLFGLYIVWTLLTYAHNKLNTLWTSRRYSGRWYPDMENHISINSYIDLMPNQGFIVNKVPLHYLFPFASTNEFSGQGKWKGTDLGETLKLTLEFENNDATENYITAILLYKFFDEDSELFIWSDSVPGKKL